MFGFHPFEKYECRKKNPLKYQNSRNWPVKILGEGLHPARFYVHPVK